MTKRGMAFGAVFCARLYRVEARTRCGERVVVACDRDPVLRPTTQCSKRRVNAGRGSRAVSHFDYRGRIGGSVTTSRVCPIPGVGTRQGGSRRWTALLGLLVAVALITPARAGEQDFYIVTDYDPRRDNVELVTNAMKRADAEDKRVLLILGGDWCGWCKVLENNIDESEELTAMLTRHYVVAKVHCDSGSPGIRYKPRKQPKYGASFVNIRAKSYPHLVILDSDGKRLLSRDMGGLVENRRYSEPKLLRILNRHKS